MGTFCYWGQCGSCDDCGSGETSDGSRRNCVRCGDWAGPCVSRSWTKSVDENLAAVALNNSCAFLFGAAKGLLGDRIDGLKTLAELPAEMQAAFDDWRSLDWGDGPALAHALRDSAAAAAGLWDALSRYTPLPAALEGSCEAFVATVAPELVVAYEGGKILYHLYENSKDVTETVGALYRSFAYRDYEAAGEALGRLVHDGLELKGGGEVGASEPASAATTTTTTTTGCPPPCAEDASPCTCLVVAAS
jgi:hypothetical protein